MSEREDLARGTRLMTLGTAISRVSGFFRTLALAYVLGSGDLADAYNLANNGPNIVYELILGGVLAGTLLPVFASAFAKESTEDAWRAVSAVFTLACTAGLVLVALLLVGAPAFIDLYTVFSRSDSQDTQRVVATSLLRFFALQVFFYAFISAATALLHTKRSFAPPMFAPIFNNLVVIGLLAVLHFSTDQLSLENVEASTPLLVALGLGTTAGVAAMALLLVPYLRRVTEGQLRWNWEPRHPMVGRVLRLSGWTIGFVVTNQIALFTTTALAYRGEGDLTAFLYAYTFFILPHGIFAVSVMSALQPGLAESAARVDWSAFRNRLASGLRLVLFVIVPAAAGYALLAHPIVDVVLLHGEYTEEGAETTGDLVALLVAGLPGFTSFVFLCRAFQAMQDTRTVFYLYAFENGVNLVTCFPFYWWFGVQGLALSHSFAYLVGAVLAAVLLRRRINGLAGAFAPAYLARVLLASGVMSAVVAGALYASDTALVQIGLGVTAGTIVFIGITKALRFSELNLLLRRGL